MTVRRNVMLASELDFEFPSELIADAPLAEREASRLMCLRRGQLGVTHAHVRDLPSLLRPSLILLNDTKVIPARIYARKHSGGRVELLLVERISPAGTTERWIALGKTSKGLVAEMPLVIDDDELRVRIVTLRGRGELEVELHASSGVAAALARAGQMPLPPYIRRAPVASDQERYQTVFAAHEGAVAAPTAGLHLSESLLAQLRAQGHELAFVTLHVGPGTFAPLRSDDLTQHVMHAERYHVPEATAQAIARARREGRQVLAVGTTVVRTLESVASVHGEVVSGSGETSIFIYPPYRFHVIDALLTNFHWPRSTLLALVMAFGGIEPVRDAYAQAVANRYRFFSYGDAMLLTPDRA
jgi:S-adenosylmethionine:tRNA ribosyltransferase-isomerase